VTFEYYIVTDEQLKELQSLLPNYNFGKAKLVHEEFVDGTKGFRTDLTKNKDYAKLVEDLKDTLNALPIETRKASDKVNFEKDD